MAFGAVGAYGAAGGQQALQILREALAKRAQLEMENELKLRSADRADAQLGLDQSQLAATLEQNTFTRNRQTAQDEAINEDRQIRRALDTREMLPPETFIPEDDPAVGVFGKAGLSGTLRVAPETPPMGPEFAGPMPDGETPQQAQVGRVRGRLTMPTQRQAATAEDDRRAQLQAEAQAQAQERMDRQAEEQARHNRVMETRPVGGQRPLQDELKEFEAKEQIKAKYSGTRPSLGQERQTLAYYNRAKQASEDIGLLEPEIAKLGLMGQTRMEIAPNFLQSQAGQSYRQAQRAFTEARLRKESGAAIPQGEYDNDARTYFAQPGDSPETMAQKKRAREVVLEGLKFASGKAFDEFYGGQTPKVTITSIQQVP